MGLTSATRLKHCYSNSEQKRHALKLRRSVAIAGRTFVWTKRPFVWTKRPENQTVLTDSASMHSNIFYPSPCNQSVILMKDNFKLWPGKACVPTTVWHSEAVDLRFLEMPKSPSRTDCRSCPAFKCSTKELEIMDACPFFLDFFQSKKSVESSEGK